jgi:hypothetical protein
MTDTIYLLSLKIRHGVDRDANVAILSGRKAHLHKSPSPTANSFVDLSTKTDLPDFRAVLGNNLSVEPSRTIAGNLPVEADGRERPYSQPIAALAEVVGLPTLDDVLRNLPIIGIASPLARTRPTIFSPKPSP